MADVQDDKKPGRGRTWIVLSVLVAVIALAVAAAFIVPPLLSSNADPTPNPSATPTVPPRDIVGPDAPRPSQTPSPAPTASDAPFAELTPVAPDATVVTAEGVEISLSRIEAVQGEAALAGETSGPAIRVTVRLVNSGSDPLDLEYVTVNAYSGEDRAPAGTLMQPGGAPFEGSLASGDSADGVYLFTIPEADRKDVTITVDYLFGAPVAVFRGDLR
jgi:hypothetical protein